MPVNNRVKIWLLNTKSGLGRIWTCAARTILIFLRYCLTYRLSCIHTCASMIYWSIVAYTASMSRRIPHLVRETCWKILNCRTWLHKLGEGINVQLFHLSLLYWYLRLLLNKESKRMVGFHRSLKISEPCLLWITTHNRIVYMHYQQNFGSSYKNSP